MTLKNSHLLPKGIDIFGFGFASLCTYAFIAFASICIDLKQKWIKGLPEVLVSFEWDFFSAQIVPQGQKMHSLSTVH